MDTLRTKAITDTLMIKHISELENHVTKLNVFSFLLKGLLLSQGIWMFDQKLCGTHNSAPLSSAGSDREGNLR